MKTMTPEQWQKIEQLYHAALEQPRERRAALLEGACAGDGELRREVESLLASHESAASFIEAPPADLAAGMVAEAEARSMRGRTLGRYRLGQLLGTGGMGEVYRARDLRLGREVAVKILPEHLASHPEALRRFEHEARAVAALAHPNILSIYDFGAEDGVSYAVMELLEGETLRARLARGPLDWDEAQRIGLAVGEGLAAAHEKGIIHRDLKPESIFLTTAGQVKILDFGVARMKYLGLPDAETLQITTPRPTQPGMLIGTLGYMSPEQVRGETADAPSDLFGLGCVLHEMLSGHRPFDRPTSAETLAAILGDAPPALPREIPARLRQLTQRCLQKDTHARVQSARDFVAELRALGDGPTATREGRPSRVRPAMLAVLLLLAALSAILFFARTRRAPAATPKASAETLSYFLEVASPDGTTRRATGAEPLAEGQSFRFHFVSRERGSLFILGPGEKNAPTTFLTARPLPETGVTSNRVEAGAEFSFPAGEGNAIGLGTYGTVSAFTVLLFPDSATPPAFLSAPAYRPLTDAQQSELAALWKTARIAKASADASGTAMRVSAEGAADRPVIFEIAVKRK